MILLDAHALVAYLIGEPVATEVEALLGQGDTAVTSVNLAEAVDVSARVHGIPRDEVSATIYLLTRTGLRVIACDEGHGVAAGELRDAYYDGRTRAVSMADCFLVAAAGEADRIATADPAVLAVARSEGIEVVPLRDSKGRRA